MSAHFVRTNGNVNLVHEFEEASELPVTTVEDCSHALWNRGMGDHGTEEEPIFWDDLTEDDMLAIQHIYLRQTMMGLAEEYQREIFDEVAKASTQVAVDERHGLGE